MNLTKLKIIIWQYKTMILISSMSIILITKFILVKNRMDSIQHNEPIINNEAPLEKIKVLNPMTNNNFRFSLPNELGQFFPNQELGMYSLYCDSQEFLIQKPLISTFFEEVVDEAAFSQLSVSDQKNLLNFNAHLLPRKFVFHLIKNIKNPKGYNQYIGTNQGFKESQNIKNKTFTFVLREDAQFENGTPINALTVQTAINTFAGLFGDYKEILGLSSDNNCIEVFYDKPYEFTLNLAQPQSLFEVIKNLNRIILIEKQEYDKSINHEKQIKYGTQPHPFLSYGPYKIKRGYNDTEWKFIKNDRYFGKKENVLPYEEIQIFIEKNQGASFQEKELFQENKLHFYACEENKIDPSFFQKFQKDLFCKPDCYSLVIGFSSNPRVSNLNLRKAFFYGIDRKKLTEKYPFISPSLDLMSDSYVDKESSIFSFNETPPHQNNVLQRFREDLQTWKTYSHNETLENDVQLLKHNIGYHPELAQFFFQQYTHNQNNQNTQPIELLLATRDGSFTNEAFISEFRNQIKTAFNIDNLPPINLQYRLNDSQADINILVSGLNPACLISPEAQKIRQGTVKNFRLDKEELQKIPELEKQAYSQLFHIPLAQQKQIRFLRVVEKNFIKYFQLFGFRTQPYDFVVEYL